MSRQPSVALLKRAYDVFVRYNEALSILKRFWLVRASTSKSLSLRREHSASIDW